MLNASCRRNAVLDQSAVIDITSKTGHCSCIVVSITEYHLGLTVSFARLQILLKGTYVGRIADAWSAGVALYALLNGAFPFARIEDNFENEVILQPSSMHMHTFGRQPMTAHACHVSQVLPVVKLCADFESAEHSLVQCCSVPYGSVDCLH